MYASIAGTGSYLPARVITNADFERVLDTTDAWIRERTGIERRRRAADDETTVDMGEHAARAAIAAAGLKPEQIDLIIFGTTTPDLVFPNCGTLLQARLGCRGAPAFSVEAACSGFIYALAIADQFVRGGQSQRALVVGSEKLSCITDHGDRSTAILFGDGAGAVVLTPHEHRGIISTHLHSDGSYAALLTGTGGVAKPLPDGQRPLIRMAGGEVFKLAVNKLGQIVDETLHANGLDKSAIDWLVPHQANIRIIQAISRKLDMPMERVIVTVAEHGNTSTASVPLALDTGVRDGRIKRGELLLLEAFGGGLTWGSALIRF